MTAMRHIEAGHIHATSCQCGQHFCRGAFGTYCTYDLGTPCAPETYSNKVHLALRSDIVAECCGRPSDRLCKIRQGQCTIFAQLLREHRVDFDIAFARAAGPVSCVVRLGRSCGLDFDVCSIRGGSRLPVCSFGGFLSLSAGARCLCFDTQLRHASWSHCMQHASTHAAQRQSLVRHWKTACSKHRESQNDGLQSDKDSAQGIEESLLWDAWCSCFRNMRCRSQRSALAAFDGHSFGMLIVHTILGQNGS